MEQHHFDIILEQLIMIERNTRVTAHPLLSSPVTDIDESDDLKRVRSYFYNGLDAKTGWDRNEIKELFEHILERVRRRGRPELSITPIKDGEYPF